MERIYKGDCYFCGEPIYVAEGQMYTRLTLKHPITGDSGGEYPVHKKCQKENK